MVWIDPYYRLRFGRWEYVTGHWRQLPSSDRLPWAPGASRMPTAFPLASTSQVIPAASMARWIASRLLGMGRLLAAERSMTDYVVTGLVKRRAEIAGQIEAIHEQLKKLLADLEAVDAALGVFDPSIACEQIKPKALRRRPIGPATGKRRASRSTSCAAHLSRSRRAMLRCRCLLSGH